jgi:hypothetical protein
MADSNLEGLARVFDVAAGQLELLNQAALRPDVDRASLKAQCFDLVVEALGAQAQRLGSEPSARKLLEKLAAHRQSALDVRTQLIRLSEGWSCSACGRDVAAGAAISRLAPLEAQLICRNCGAKTALAPAGQLKLQQLFGAAAAAAGWNPTLHGFVP